MRFKEVRINELLEFMESDFYKNSKVIPISTNRILSQYNNPNSKPNDVALIVAYDVDNQIAGYIGILPGKISLEETPFHWNSCWWVDPEKGKHVAMPLFYKMLKICRENLVFFEMTELTKNIVEKIGAFHTEEGNKGVRGYVRFHFKDILSGKNRFFKKISPALYLMDFTFNVVNDVRLSFWNRGNEDGLRVDHMKEIDEETEEFLRGREQEQLIPKTKKELDWIIKYPWLNDAPTEQEKEMAERYYFSWIVKSFSNHLLKVIKNDKVIGLLFFTLRDRNLKLPYCYVDDEELASIEKVIYSFLIQHKANSFTLFHKKLVDRVEANGPFYFKKNIARYVAYPKRCLDLGMGEKIIQDGDGDAVFC